MMTYREALEIIMENNGGFAPLNLIYKSIWNYKDKSEIKGQTPNATIRETLQRSKVFFPLGIGVWGLSKYKHILTAKETPTKTKAEKQERMHAKIQGMLLELGNQRGLDTYTNDKSWIFNNKKLGSLCSLQEIPPFTYNEIIQRSVKYVDVAWFSQDKYAFPVRICEVEDSTDFRAALTKFKELEFFNTEFYCISSDKRKAKFDTEINKNAFKSLINRVEFISYEQIIATYEHEMKKIRF